MTYHPRDYTPNEFAQRHSQRLYALFRICSSYSSDRQQEHSRCITLEKSRFMQDGESRMKVFEIQIDEIRQSLVIWEIANVGHEP